MARGGRQIVEAKVGKQSEGQSLFLGALPKRGISLFGQRFITTFNTAASARSAAASLMTPICIQTDLAPAFMASSTASTAASLRRKIWHITMGSPTLYTQIGRTKWREK